MVATMQIAVDALRATRPRTEGRVIDLLEPLPAAATASERANRNRWMLGVKWVPWGRTLDQFTVDQCANDAQLTNEINASSEVAFQAWRVDAAVQCSTITFDFEGAREMLTTDARLYQNPAIAKRLTTTLLTHNFLADATPATTALAAVRAIGAIEDTLNTNLKGALGNVYMPSTVLAEGYWAVDDDDDGDEGPSGICTILGHSIAVDPLFGTPPTGQSSGANETWIYGSGPLWGAVSEPHFDGDNWQYVNYVTNIATLRVQFEALVAYDPSTLFAQKVCLSTCPA